MLTHRMSSIDAMVTILTATAAVWYCRLHAPLAGQLFGTSGEYSQRSGGRNRRNAVRLGQHQPCVGDAVDGNTRRPSLLLARNDQHPVGRQDEVVLRERKRQAAGVARRRRVVVLLMLRAACCCRGCYRGCCSSCCGWDACCADALQQRMIEALKDSGASVIGASIDVSAKQADGVPEWQRRQCERLTCHGYCCCTLLRLRRLRQRLTQRGVERQVEPKLARKSRLRFPQRIEGHELQVLARLAGARVSTGIVEAEATQATDAAGGQRGGGAEGHIGYRNNKHAG